MLQASGSDAALLRQELTAEQRARQEAVGRLAGLETQLAQVRGGGQGRRLWARCAC